MGHILMVTAIRYIHATDQGKRGAIVMVAEYRQQFCRKVRHKRTASISSIHFNSLK